MDLLEIKLLSNDLAGTRQFYHHRLGMDIQSDGDGQLKLAAGLSTLVFEKSKAPAIYHFAFTIPSNRFDEAHAWAGANMPLIPVNGQETVADFKNWNARAFYFYDNNHNIVEMIARFDLSNMSAQPFDGASVCSVSEIGLVADKAELFGRQLIEDYGLGYFTKQPPQHDFLALGDDYGLFIVVSEQRQWYPTQQPAGKYFTAVKFNQGGNIRQVVLNGRGFEV